MLHLSLMILLCATSWPATKITQNVNDYKYIHREETNMVNDKMWVLVTQNFLNFAIFLNNFEIR